MAATSGHISSQVKPKNNSKAKRACFFVTWTIAGYECVSLITCIFFKFDGVQGRNLF
jgi:hypothetical protein